MQESDLVVRNADGSTTPLLDWLQSDRARVFLGCPPAPVTFSTRQLLLFGLVAFVAGALLGAGFFWWFF